MDRRPALFLAPYCAQHNIKLLPYGVLAGGFIAERYLNLPADK
jgi:aryl-alcohol dehydrogenase-like predicted oxidoreductase